MVMLNGVAWNWLSNGGAVTCIDGFGDGNLLYGRIDHLRFMNGVWFVDGLRFWSRLLVMMVLDGFGFMDWSLVMMVMVHRFLLRLGRIEIVISGRS